MIGKTISHYKIIEQIGSGGMGVVYKAQDLKLDRHVALKFLPPHLTNSEEEKKRFIQEAKAASALEHNNICNVHEIAETNDGQLFIVMACYDGETLKEKIKDQRLKKNEALDIAIQIALGLQKAHKKQIVHRDIKPANILITLEGNVKILDFGLAKLSGQTQMTKAGSTLGTVAYMSPEQSQGEAVDRRTDIWSIGVMLYEMLTGRLPFRGDYEQAIIYSILNEEPEPPRHINAEISPAVEDVINRALVKDPESRFASLDEFLTALELEQSDAPGPGTVLPGKGKGLHWLLKPPVAITVLVLITAALFIGWWIYSQNKISWARDTAIPEIEKMIDGAGFFIGLTSAFELAREAQKYIPNDPKLNELILKCSRPVLIKTDPEGARVYVKKYQTPGEEWIYFGITPIDTIKLARDYFRWKIEKAGYQTGYFATGKFQLRKPLNFALYEENSVPPGMVRIKSDESDAGILPDFYYDKYEVTNKAFKTFIDASGYRNQAYWQFPFTKDGKNIAWEEAIAQFIDKTGRPGPAGWEAGDYPDGHAEYPVTGISWYEAAAYAAFKEKELPTIHDWNVANGVTFPFPKIPPSLIVPQSHFGGDGPAPVGTSVGISVNGAYDIAGNVREWCMNEAQQGRCIVGGAWNDALYMAFRITQSSPFDRSTQNGFRCVQYIDRDSIPASAFKAYSSSRKDDDYRKREPVSEEIFQVYKESFSYDKEALEPALEYSDETPEDWIKEKISYNASYDNERIIAYLYLPRHVSKPYQTVIIYPSSQATTRRSSENLENMDTFDFFIKDGRAVLYPIYKSTYERGGEEYWGLTGQVSTRKYFDLITKIVRDFRRSVDYLETRRDIDMDKIAYYSYSWGGELVSIIAAVEDRLKLILLNTGGMRGFDAGGKIYPAVDPINYVTRVKIPTLMLNGKFDLIYKYDKVVKPMYDNLGTSEEDKLLIIYPTGHYVLKNDLIKETLQWLDRYFGPVKYKK